MSNHTVLSRFFSPFPAFPFTTTLSGFPGGTGGLGGCLAFLPPAMCWGGTTVETAAIPAELSNIGGGGGTNSGNISPPFPVGWPPRGPRLLRAIVAYMEKCPRGQFEVNWGRGGGGTTKGWGPSAGLNVPWKIKQMSCSSFDISLKILAYCVLLLVSKLYSRRWPVPWYKFTLRSSSERAVII